MQSRLDAQVRRQLQERFRDWAWMGPLGNMAAALVWVAAIAGTGADRPTVVAWSIAMALICALMAVAYLLPISLRWTDRAGVPYLTLVSLGGAGVLWGATLWLDGSQVAPEKYIYGTVAVLLAVVSGSMVASCGIARVTGTMLVPLALGTVAGLARDAMWVEAAGLAFLAVLITPVQIDSAGGIRELVKLRLASEEAACRDPLTGLLNRRGLSEALQRFTPREVVSVLFADLDGFKAINDEFGHDAGDAVLCSVARDLTADLPDTAIVSRFGGDEFVAVVPHVRGRPDEAVRRLRTTLHPDVRKGEGPSQVAMSLGMADGLASDVERSLLAQADRAMFVNKRRTRAACERGRVIDLGSELDHDLDQAGSARLASLGEAEN